MINEKTDFFSVLQQEDKMVFNRIILALFQEVEHFEAEFLQSLQECSALWFRRRADNSQLKTQPSSSQKRTFFDQAVKKELLTRSISRDGTVNAGAQSLPRPWCA